MLEYIWHGEEPSFQFRPRSLPARCTPTRQIIRPFLLLRLKRGSIGDATFVTSVLFVFNSTTISHIAAGSSYTYWSSQVKRIKEKFMNHWHLKHIKELLWQSWQEFNRSSRRSEMLVVFPRWSTIVVASFAAQFLARTHKWQMNH